MQERLGAARSPTLAFTDGVTSFSVVEGKA